MFSLPDNLRNLLPPDREEALEALFEFTFEMYKAQWEPGGQVYDFGRDAWQGGIARGMEFAVESFQRRYQLIDAVDIPSPDDAGWEATFEAFFKTKVPTPMNMKELADHIGRSHGTVRTKSSELFPGRKTDSGVS